jgi:hypothetical protein
MSTELACGHCGEVIGVYEPAVFIRDGEAHHTSQAASPELCDEASERYHRACHAARANGPGHPGH